MVDINIKLTISQNKLLNMLIGLTNQVFLPPLDMINKGSWIEEEFICGDGKEKTHFVLTWAISVKGKKILNDIVSLLRQEFFISATRRKILIDYILNFLKDNCLNKNLFSGDAILFSKIQNKKTLFACQIYEDPKYFGFTLMDLLVKDLKNRVQKLIIIYPLHRVKMETDSFYKDSALFIKSDYTEGWKKIRNENPVLNHFDPQNYTIFNQKPFYALSSPPEAWMIYFFFGDRKNNLNVIKKRVRVILTFLVAEIYRIDPQIVLSSMAPTDNILIIFSEDGKCEELFAENLLHSFPGELSLSKENLDNIFNHLMALKSCTNQKKVRFDLFAEFFIKSLNNNMEERIINQFIAIDALWGIDGKSKESICKNIERALNSSPRSKLKAEKLYRLRCALLHGGCSILDEWNSYDRYINTFKTEPTEDLITIITKTINDPNLW